jgi:hypothetical protein
MKKFKILVLILCFCQVLSAQTSVIKDVYKIISEKGEAKILIPKKEVKDLNLLAKTISLDYPKNDSWLGYVNQKQYNKFLLLNIKHSLYIEDNSTKALTMATTMAQMSSWDRYPTYRVYDSLMRSFALNYPNICKLDTIGFSVNNRLILALRISSNPYSDIDKPKFCYSSTMHGDELTGYVLLLRLADWLLSNYSSNQRVMDIINNTQIFINPLANPDGTYGFNNNNVSYATRYNANFVDLNRNFPSLTSGSNADGESLQKETLAFMSYADSNEFSISANLHGGAEVLNYPYDSYKSSSVSHSDENWFINVCTGFINSIPSSAPSSFFRDITHSGYTNGGNWYMIDGSRQDYHTYFKYGREITFEVSSQKSLSTTELNNYWNYLNLGLIAFIENCQKGLQGYVRDSATNEPLRAKIWVENHDSFHSEVYSKASSGYYYRPILDGNYSITYSANGYFPKTIDNLSISSMTNQDVYLVKSGIGINDVGNANEGLLIYPNPAKDIISVRLNKSNLKDDKSYKIYNSLGICLLSDFVDNNIMNIDISNLNKGLYFIEIGNKVLKFIKD